MITLASSTMKRKHFQTINDFEKQRQYVNVLDNDLDDKLVLSRLNEIEYLINMNKSYFKTKINNLRRYETKKYLEEGNSFVEKYLELFEIDKFRFYNTREFEVTQLKIALSRVLLEKYYPVTAIADILRKHHSSINYYIRQDFAFNIVANSFYKRIKEIENDTNWNNRVSYKSRNKL